MPLTQVFSGSAAISGTETSLVTNTAGPDAETSDGIIQAFVDISDMIASDTLQIRLYEKARSGDTQRLAKEWILTGVQSEPLWISDSYLLLHGWDVTVLALAGTITVNWSLRSAT